MTDLNTKHSGVAISVVLANRVLAPASFAAQSNLKGITILIFVVLACH